MPKCTTKAAALAAGEAKYFTGIPCKNGHVAMRRTSGGGCVECARARVRKYDRANPHKWAYRNASDRGYPEPTRPMPETCECCGKPESLRRGLLCLDHDHVTGNFRGWLCHRCNSGIGLVGDTLEALEAAVNYIRRATVA